MSPDKNEKTEVETCDLENGRKGGREDGCNRPLTPEEDVWRQGRKSTVMPMRGKANSKVRYIEGTTPLKNGCWLAG